MTGESLRVLPEGEMQGFPKGAENGRPQNLEATRKAGTSNFGRLFWVLLG